mgnify:CR=1 FL=1
MSLEVEKKQLKLLKKRLKKAYSLPKSEQEKWQEEIEKLENQSNILRTQLGIGFDENKAVEMLIDTNREIAKNVKGNYGDGKFNKFLDSNPRANELCNQTNEINIAYKLRDIEYFKRCLEKYKNSILAIDKMYVKELMKC